MPDRRGQVDATGRMVRALPGVVGVHNLRYLLDDGQTTNTGE